MVYRERPVLILVAGVHAVRVTPVVLRAYGVPRVLRPGGVYLFVTVRHHKLISASLHCARLSSRE